MDFKFSCRRTLYLSSKIKILQVFNFELYESKESSFLVEGEDGCVRYNPDEDMMNKPERDFEGFRFLANSGNWFLVIEFLFQSLYHRCVRQEFDRSTASRIAPM